MKQLKLRNIIYVGAAIWAFGLCVLITAFILLLAHVRYFFNDEEWIGFGLVVYAGTNLINFVLYLPFYFQNKKLLNEIENENIRRLKAEEPAYNFLSWNPFSMKWYKAKVLLGTKKWFKDDEYTWNFERKDYWEDRANLQAKIATFTLMRPIYMMFVFSILSFLKLLAVNKYMNERKEA